MTERQQQIAEQLADGAESAAIARCLDCSERTVEADIRHLKTFFGVHSIRKLISVCARRKYGEPEYLICAGRTWKLQPTDKGKA